MKVQHGEEIANHSDPESCVCTREGAGEALTGKPTGQVLSREIRVIRDADAVIRSGRQYDTGR
jgi:hypothetical protein